MRGLRLSSFRTEDEVCVRRLVDEIWGHDPTFHELYGFHGAESDDPFRRTLVARRDGELVGVGTVALGLRHPLRLWLTVHVRSDLRRRGVGTELLLALRRRAGESRGFRVTAPLADEASVGFLRARGFELLNRCHEGWIDPQDTQLLAQVHTLASAVPQIRVSRPVRVRPDELQQAADFFGRWYEDTHRWDEPVRWLPDAALAHFCDDSLVEDSLVFAYNQEKLIGAAALLRPPVGDRSGLYLNQLGILDIDTHRMPAVAAALLEPTLQYARDHGSRIAFEIDESNTSLWRVIAELPIAPTRVIGNYAEM